MYACEYVCCLRFGTSGTVCLCRSLRINAGCGVVYGIQALGYPRTVN